MKALWCSCKKAGWVLVQGSVLSEELGMSLLQEKDLDEPVP